MRHLQVLSFILLSFYGLLLNAEEAVFFHHLSTQNGLSQNIVTDICQDKYGYIWISTRNGLNRYDGAQIKTYFHNELDPFSLPENSIQKLFLDKEQQLWIYSHNSINLYRYKTDDFKQYKITEKSRKVSTYPIDEYFKKLSDYPFNIPINNRNILHYDRELDTFYSILPIIPNVEGYYVPFTYFEDKNTLWIFVASNDDKMHSIVKYNNLTKESKIINQRTPHILGALKDKTNRIWFGSWLEGLFWFNDKTDRVERFLFQDPVLNEKIKDKIICEMVEDGYGNVWFVVWGLGLLRYNTITENTRLYTYREVNANTICSNTLQNIIKTKDGNIWFGSLTKGVNYFDPSHQKIRHIKRDIQKKTTLSNNSIYALLEDDNKNIWIGTDGGGLDIYKPDKTFQNYSIQNGLASKTVISFFQDKDKNIWIGNWFGFLQKYNPRTEKISTYDGKNEKACTERTVRDITSFSPNEILFCGEFNGVTSYDTKTETFSVWKDTLGKPISTTIGAVYTIAKDSNGTFWLGGQGCLTSYNRNTKQFDFPMLENGKKANPFHVWNLLYDEDYDCIWIGTNGMGLKKLDFKNKKVKSIPFLKQLSSEVVYGILKKAKDEIWLSSTNGIYKIDLKNETYTRFDKSSGLQDNEFTQGAFASLENGEMMFGGQYGFNIIDPDNMKQEQHMCPIVIHNIEIDSEKKRIQNYDETIEIPFEHNDILIQYALLDFTYNSKVKYKYILQNYDKEWESCDSSQRTARYTNLPSGKYDFILKAMNSDGVWNEKGLRLSFRILKPYWETWWFISFFIIFIFLLGYLLLHFRMKYVVNKNKQLEKIIDENISDIRQQKQKLESIFNNAIAGMIITDAKFNVLFANKYFADLANVEHENVTNIDLRKYINENSIIELQSKFHSLKTKSSNFYVNTKLSTKDNANLWVGLSCSKLYENKEVRYLFVIIDISEQKESEQKILELEKQSSALAMAVTANHELNQPLMVIQGNVEMLFLTLEDKMNEKQKLKVKKVFNSIEIMSEILNKYKNNKALSFDSYTEETDMVKFEMD